MPGKPVPDILKSSSKINAEAFEALQLRWPMNSLFAEYILVGGLAWSSFRFFPLIDVTGFLRESIEVGVRASPSSSIEVPNSIRLAVLIGRTLLADSGK